MRSNEEVPNCIHRVTRRLEDDVLAAPLGFVIGAIYPLPELLGFILGACKTSKSKFYKKTVCATCNPTRILFPSQNVIYIGGSPAVWPI